MAQKVDAREETAAPESKESLPEARGPQRAEPTPPPPGEAPPRDGAAAKARAAAEISTDGSSKARALGEPKAERKAATAIAPLATPANDAGARAEEPAQAHLAPLDALSLRDAPIPHVPPSTASGPWRSYKEVLAGLAQRVLDAQRPIRILQALRWEGEVEEQFFRDRQRELPRVTYSSDLGFDPEAKIRELDGILRDADRELGPTDRLAGILRATADEYREVVRMLTARGSRDFYASSRKLYGSTKDTFPDGVTTVRDMGFVLYDLFTAVGGERLGAAQPRDITAEAAAVELNARFDRFFSGSAKPVDGKERPPSTIRVEVDDTLLADAAAGGDYVKIRSGATFSRSDVDILEAHEGWVHVATSLNGQAQPVARWLAKGPPRTTAVQEGLAALVEIFTFRSTPRRAKKLNDRILAVDKAEDGASFLDVFEWYRTEGYDEAECFQNARRVFRGGLLTGGAPFTKDACYCRGIVLNYAFMRAAIQLDRAQLIPFLFVGKVAHEDVPVLYAHVTDGIVKPPPFLPPIFEDLNGLAIWLCYSSFFSRLGGTAIAEHYTKLLV